MISVCVNYCTLSCDRDWSVQSVTGAWLSGVVEWWVLFKKWWTPSSPTHHLPRQIMSRVLILLHLRHLGRLSPRRGFPLVEMDDRVRAESQWEAGRGRHRWPGSGVTAVVWWELTSVWLNTLSWAGPVDHWECRVKSPPRLPQFSPLLTCWAWVLG